MNARCNYKVLLFVASLPLIAAGDSAFSDSEPDSATFVNYHDNVSLENAVYDRIDLFTGRIVETNFLIVGADDIKVRGKSLKERYIALEPDGINDLLFPVVCNGKISILHAPDTISHISVDRAKSNACDGIYEDEKSGRLQKTIFYKIAKVDSSTVRTLYFFTDDTDTPIYPPIIDPWVLEASMKPPDMNELMNDRSMMEEKIIRLCQKVAENAERIPANRILPVFDTAIYLARRYYFESDTVVKNKLFMTFYFFNQDMYRIAFPDGGKDVTVKRAGKKDAKSGKKAKKKLTVSVNAIQKNGNPERIYYCCRQLLSRAPFHHDTLKIRNPDGSWVTDLEGRTLLTYACRHNQSPERVKILVKTGLPVDLEDRYGKTPQRYCIENNNKKLRKLVKR
jgi:hypothetical protein